MQAPHHTRATSTSSSARASIGHGATCSTEAHGHLQALRASPSGLGMGFCDTWHWHSGEVDMYVVVGESPEMQAWRITCQRCAPRLRSQRLRPPPSATSMPVLRGE
jgi:hypothetical protein